MRTPIHSLSLHLQTDTGITDLHRTVWTTRLVSRQSYRASLNVGICCTHAPGHQKCPFLLHLQVAEYRKLPTMSGRQQRVLVQPIVWSFITSFLTFTHPILECHLQKSAAGSRAFDLEIPWCLTSVFRERRS